MSVFSLPWKLTIELRGRGCYSATAEYYMLLALQSWRQRLLLYIIIKREKNNSATFTSAISELDDKEASVKFMWARSYTFFEEN